MRFIEGDIVVVTINEDLKKGVIDIIKVDSSYRRNGGQTHSVKYLVKFDDGVFWYREKDLSYPEDVVILHEDKVNKVLIDAALDTRRFDIIRGILKDD